uniref:Potassium channel domain-containing protein n=1 Tax=Plectus sambesii TaxID=2011161 RepID=A0A914V8Y1_9BILA
MSSSVLYAFTLLTTIGYGNITPTTLLGQAFTMVYGVVGIPLFLIAIADLGRFFKTGVMSVIQFCCTTDLIKKPEEHRMCRELAEVFLVSFVFIGFIAVGSAFLTIWEQDLSYFDSVYFSYISLTTIGLGDIVPRRSEFMIITLIYITVGLWLTTAVVEQMADVFKLVHYAGRRVGNVKG